MSVSNAAHVAGLMAALLLCAPVPLASADTIAGLGAAEATCNASTHRRYSLSWSPSLAIPENDPIGILTPPLPIPDTAYDPWGVGIDLTLSHQYDSDLIVTASCDVQCDGIPEASVELLNRACLGSRGVGGRSS